jgi:hypothetical protein
MSALDRLLDEFDKMAAREGMLSLAMRDVAELAMRPS